MKKICFTIIALLFIQRSLCQSNRIQGPVEHKMTDSLCSCVEKVDISKITNKAQAKAAYVDCVEKHLDILKDLADERKVNMADNDAMEKIGIDLAVNLISQECKGFKQLALTMAGNNKNDDAGISGTATGDFRRIETNGFNYFIILDGNNEEKSFIWLRQFSGSENFITGSTKYVGKKIKIKYQELEVYLPLAKGYYKIKEVTGIEIL